MSDQAQSLTKVITAINKSLGSKKKEEAVKHYEAFITQSTEILQSDDSSQTVKQQITDILPLFVHRFPTMIDQSINLQFDLIEDVNQSIKLRAIKGLELIALHNQSIIDRLMDVVFQLYCAIPSNTQSNTQSNQQSAKKGKKQQPSAQSITPAQELELAAINQSIKQMFTLNAPLCFVALFNQMSECDEKLMDKLIDQLNIYLPLYRHTINQSNLEIQAKVSKHLKAALSRPSVHQSVGQSNTESTNQTLLNLLLSLRCNKTDETFTSDLSKILITQSINQTNKETTNQSFIDGCHNLKMINRSIKQSLDQSIDGTPFVEFFMEHIYPSISQSNTQVSNQTKLDLLRSFSTLVELIDQSNVQPILSKLWSLTKEYLPLKQSATQSDDQTVYSIIEALLVCVNHLASMSADAAKEALQGNKQDTVKRLTLLKGNVQTWLQTLNQSIESIIETIKQSKTPETKKQLSDAKTQQLIANSLTSLIDCLIECKYVADGACSWRKAKKAQSNNQSNAQSNNQPKKQPKEKKQPVKQSVEKPATPSIKQTAAQSKKRKSVDAQTPNKKQKQSNDQTITENPSNTDQSNKKRKNEAAQSDEPIAKKAKQTPAQSLKPSTKQPVKQSKDDAAAAAYAAELESQAAQFYTTGVNNQLNIDSINQSIKQTVNQAKQDKKLKTQEHQAARAWGKRK